MHLFAEQDAYGLNPVVLSLTPRWRPSACRSASKRATTCLVSMPCLMIFSASQYCGFDGTSFNGWQQLSVDRILPGKQGGKYELGNTITACNACNTITSRMTFEPGQYREEIIERKKAHVAERRPFTQE